MIFFKLIFLESFNEKWLYSKQNFIEALTCLVGDVCVSLVLGEELELELGIPDEIIHLVLLGLQVSQVSVQISLLSYIQQ